MKNLGYESRYEKTPRKIVYDAVYGIDDSSSSSDEELSESDFGKDVIFEFPNPDDTVLEEINGYGWVNLCTAKNPWDEKRRPVVCPLDDEDVKIDWLNLQSDGFLTHMIVATGISNLDLIPGTCSFGLTKLQLSGKNIKNITVLRTYRLLQYVDLSYNGITNLRPLKRSRYLVVLDASHNQIKTFALESPIFLSFVNLSSNKIVAMPNFSPYWSLKHLNLSYNSIYKIEGIEGLKFLRYLNLSHNKIEFVRDIKNLSLTELILSHNKISDWEILPETGPNCLYSLKVLDISHNRITTLKMINHSYNLRELNAAFNRISSITEFESMNELKAVEKLSLSGNKITTSAKDFRVLAAHFMPRLKLLNGIPVSDRERIDSVFTYGDSILLRELKNYYMRLIINNSVSPPPFGKPMTFMPTNSVVVALVGPVGSYASKLTKMIATQYPSYIKLCKFHTTFPYPKGSEENVKEFIHVSMDDFFSLEKAGKFAYVSIRLGYHYGLSIDELHSDGRICLLASGVFHAINLSWFGLKPKLILVTTSDTILFIKRIKELFNEMRTFIREEMEEHSSSNKEEAWWKMGKSESDHLQKGGKISEYEKKIETNGSPSLNNPTKLKKSNSRIKISASVSFTTQDFGEDNPLNEERSDFSQELLNCFYGKEGSSLIEEQFVRSMLNCRDKCLAIHNSRPGLFQLAAHKHLRLLVSGAFFNPLKISCNQN
ncbi:uncharacterized protein isoform X2 [Rhodnius prolixus]|uniref:uncharacterized protein isoform X2 n=1 Tax=Rhodnius prolixus TaxID=13249 RepID=UPI003D18EF45